MSPDSHRTRRVLVRRRRAKQRQAALTQAEQRRAEVQRSINRQLSSWPRRRVVAWVLFGLALLMAAQHVLAHAGFTPLPISLGWQDLLVGYPMAGIIAVVGAVILDKRPPR